jgi:ACT domain-containing protein
MKKIYLRNVRFRMRKLLLDALSCLSIALFMSNTSALNLPESTNKLMLGQDIYQANYRHFGFKGKSAEQAIEILLREGFLCYLQPLNAYGLDVPPTAICNSRSSKYGPLCEKFQIRFEMQRVDGVKSRKNMLDQLDKIQVDLAMGFCPYSRSVASEFLTGRHIGETNLQENVQKLNVLGDAKSAYDKLLIDGYACGFGQAIDLSAARNLPGLVCTKGPSEARLCFEVNVVLKVEWANTNTNSLQVIDRLKTARVTAVQASCELPVVIGGGEKS